MSQSQKKSPGIDHRDIVCSTRGRKTICIPCSEQQHNKIVADKDAFKSYIDESYTAHPELFPLDMAGGYELFGFQITSTKLGIKLRRIRLRDTKDVYTVRPSFVMPYMTERVENVEKVMFLRRFDVPYWALTYVFGRDDMYWYRMEMSFGRNSIVGTTVKDAKKLPKDVASDEKHTHHKGEKVYIATTVANECILGASISPSAGTEDLSQAYGVFQKEVHNVDPDYQPETVNTDGWEATGKAWKKLFPGIIVILCFLHAFLNIQKRCTKKLGNLVKHIGERVWKVYKAENKRSFMQRARRLREWAEKNLDGIVLEKVKSLCEKAPLFTKAYEHPGAYRTSNMVDRLMRWQDQYLFNRQYFHGKLESAELGVRAWVLLRNFQPYCSRITGQKVTYVSAAVKLNGFCYRENWLENLLVSASMYGYRQ